MLRCSYRYWLIERADDRVFVMSEEVTEYQGAYKVTRGLLDEFGAKAVLAGLKACPWEVATRQLSGAQTG